MDFCGFDINCWIIFFDILFWKSFYSELFSSSIGILLSFPLTIIATFLGAGLGVGGALWLNKRQERKETRAKDIIANKKKIDVLTEICIELQDNKRALIDYDSSDFGIGILKANLRVEKWDVFSMGGELKWIDEPPLLTILSDVYALIRSIIYISDRYFYFKITGSVNFDETTQENMQSNLLSKMDTALGLIDYAIMGLNARTESRISNMKEQD